MSSEQITKFQPDRTLYLRGFDGAGAAAALCRTSPTGFSVCGVYRDMADFCVLVLYDADNIFEHYSVRYLPDFDLQGMVLSFNISYQGLQCIDSAKYSWIDWAQLDVIPEVGPPEQVTLWEHATLVGGNYTTAQGTFNITAGTGCTNYDRLTLFVNNTAFDFIAHGASASQTAESTSDVVQWFIDNMNSYEWAKFQNSSVSVIASSPSPGQLTLKYARTGYVNVLGADVTWTLPPLYSKSNPLPVGIRFPGIPAGSTIYINQVAYQVASVTSPTSLTLTTSAGTQSHVPYLAEYGGDDGNGLTVYMIERPSNVNLHVDVPVLPLNGGNSDNVVWNISLDFTTLGIDKVRQAWLTLAPQLPTSSAYIDTEWTATFSNWSIADPNGISVLRVAGPDSARTGNADPGCAYSHTGWNVQSANNYWRGFSRVSKVPGSSVTIRYSTAHTHDLYLGTSLYIDRGTVTVTVNGDSGTTLDCYLEVGSEVVTRRLLRSALAPGNYLVTITLATAKNDASSDQYFIFDYLEAAVPITQIPDADITYSNLSPALDYDTDATYKMSPQRLLWHIRKLGFHGHMNEYLGVFWWNQRRRAGSAWNSVTVTVGGTWHDTDYAELAIGPRDPLTGIVKGFTIRKSVITWDTNETIADHFVYYINSSTVAIWAGKIPSDDPATAKFTIYIRTPNWSQSVDASAHSSTGSTGTFTCPALSIANGVPGYWQVDPGAVNPLNFAVRQWHSDLFAAVNAAGMLITASFSMELVYPPDDGLAGNEWMARYYDHSPVSTDTGFAHLVSSQCAFIPNMTAFQCKVYTAMASLQSAAGLTPWLQFGEFLWWFFSSLAANVFSISASSPAALQLSTPIDGVETLIPHNMSTGDRVTITAVSGSTELNGTWPITVIDTTTFTIPVTSNTPWVAGTGHVRGGSMAYYDTETSAAAQAALNRPLYKFTSQDDDPMVNGGADTAFLAARLKAHIDSITGAVLSEFPAAKFEILYPNDVNHPLCLLGPSVPYAQGGKLNAAVNLPPQWLTQAGSGLDSFKVEALSWSATYLNMDRAHQAIVFAVTPPMSWDPASVAYLVPWFNGTCPWPREFLLAASRGLNIVNFWAYDHLSLMSWPIPLPISLERSGFLA